MIKIRSLSNEFLICAYFNIFLLITNKLLYIKSKHFKLDFKIMIYNCTDLLQPLLR